MTSTKATAFAALALCAVALAAGPVDDRTPADRVRAGNLALAGGDLPAAERHFASAEERTDDPGLVAFNKAAVYYRRGEWRDAEAHYTRALDDRACPPERRAKALYNRGVCLIRRGGVIELRAAIDSFERCLDGTADAELTADARHNLELAKLLWNEARAKERKKPLPNDPPETPPDPMQPDPKRQDNGMGPDPGGTDTNPSSPTEPDTLPGQPKPGQAAKKTDRKAAGKGNMQVVNQGAIPPRTPEEVREYLKEIDARLAKDRKGVAQLVAPPERPNVKDW